MKKILLTVLTSLLIHTGLLAEESSKCVWKDNESYPCITITKFVLRDPSVLTTESMSVDYIDQYTIENTNIIDTVQAISKITGLNVVQSGPSGQQTSVFMRGMNSNHTMVAINGVAIKDHSTTGGLHDIGSDFVKHITGIQIVKGSQGTLYGANAVGGVINFITTDSYENSISTTIGSNNTKGFTIKIHRDIDNHSISLVTDGTKSDGISVAPSGTEKDGFDTKNITINTKSKFDGFDLRTTIIKRKSDSDLDASGSDDLDYTAESDMNLYQLSSKIDNSFGFTNFTFSRTEYDRQYLNGTELDEYDSNSNTYLLTNTFQNNKFDITPGLEFEQFDGAFTNRGGFTSSVDKDGENIGYFINGNLIVSDQLLLSAGIRQDDPSLFNDYTTYRFGGTYDLTDNFMLKGNYSTSVKTPTLYELYGTHNYGYNGNPNLLPEEATTKDFGFEYSINNTNFDLTYFTTDLENLITYGNNTYGNASGTSNRHGVEFKFDTLLSDNWLLRHGYTFTIAEDSDGDQVTRRPKWVGVTAFDYNKDNWTNTIEYLYTGSHLDVDSSTYLTVKKPAVGVANFHTKYEINDKSGIVFSLNNILDKTYERPDGYAQDGRNMFLTFKWKF